MTPAKKAILFDLCQAKFSELLQFGKYELAKEIIEITESLGFKKQADVMREQIKRDKELRG